MWCFWVQGRKFGQTWGRTSISLVLFNYRGLILFSFGFVGWKIPRSWQMYIFNFCLFLSLQATRCSFTGHLDSDPDSTVYVSGCKSEKENMDITLMSKKVKSYIYEKYCPLLTGGILWFFPPCPWPDPDTSHFTPE